MDNPKTNNNRLNLRLPGLLVFVLGLGFCLACPSNAAVPPSFEKRPIQIRTQDGRSLAFNVFLACTEAQQSYGLMHRKKLDDKEGMLFIFTPPRATAFWMKNTSLSLDMLFIEENGKIVSLHPLAKPFDETPIPTPGRVGSVLEIKGGLAQKLNLHEGDRLLPSADVFKKPACSFR